MSHDADPAAADIRDPRAGAGDRFPQRDRVILDERIGDDGMTRVDADS
jgi:hypothetical protein